MPHGLGDQCEGKLALKCSKVYIFHFQVPLGIGER